MIPEILTTIQETALTAGFMQMKGWEFSVAATQGIQTFLMSLPYNADALAIDLTLSGAEAGDNVSVIIGKDTVVGGVDNAAGHIAGSKVINVDSSVVENTRVGRIVRFGDDTVKYWVTARDQAANTITIWPKDGNDDGLTNAIADNDLVKMSVYMLDAVATPNGDTRFLGSSKIGGSGIPAGTVATIEFYNKTATAKTLLVDVELLYGDEE
jgi:hypothetical protein